jgi:uncharacterized protein
MKKLILSLLFFSHSIIVLAQSKSSFSTSEVVINPLISGTLFSSSNQSNPSTIVILIAGSGPTDRNGNQNGATNNSLKFLAQELSSPQTSVFSFDKRIIKQIQTKTIDESKLSFDDFISDANDVVSYFKNTKKYKNIVIAGHSEGSLIGMIAAQNNTNGFISIAGAGRQINEVLEEQITKQLPDVKDELHQKLEILKAGKTFDSKTMNPYIAPMFRESVQPYIISWIKYNPQTEISKLKIPVLIINGDKDLQVPVTDAEMLQKAKPDAKLEIIKEMNHILKDIKGDATENVASYNNADLAVNKEIVQKIKDYLASLK